MLEKSAKEILKMKKLSVSIIMSLNDSNVSRIQRICSTRNQELDLSVSIMPNIWFVINGSYFFKFKLDLH